MLNLLVPRAVLRRAAVSLATLLIIAWLTLFGLIMAERGREGLPAEPLSAAGEALLRTVTYLTDHPKSYYWAKYESSAFELVATTFKRSAGLLLISQACFPVAPVIEFRSSQFNTVLVCCSSLSRSRIQTRRAFRRQVTRESPSITATNPLKKPCLKTLRVSN
jgi:hypothetical protein